MKPICVRWLVLSLLFACLLNGRRPTLTWTPPPTPCPWYGCEEIPGNRQTSTDQPISLPNVPTPEARINSASPTLEVTSTLIPPTDTVNPPVAGNTLTCTYKVDAKEYSTARQYLDTGMMITAGSTLVIKASGTACFDEDHDHCGGPDGHPEFVDTDLVGKIGDGGMFHIGSDFSKTVSEGGRLYLGYHDNDFLNNSGYFEVKVTFENSPTGSCGP